MIIQHGYPLCREHKQEALCVWKGHFLCLGRCTVRILLRQCRHHGEIQLPIGYNDWEEWPWILPYFNNGTKTMNMTFCWCLSHSKWRESKSEKPPTCVWPMEHRLLLVRSVGLYLLRLSNYSMYTFLPSNQNKGTKTDHQTSGLLHGEI